MVVQVIHLDQVEPEVLVVVVVEVLLLLALLELEHQVKVFQVVIRKVIHQLITMMLVEVAVVFLQQAQMEIVQLRVQVEQD